jgi:hypothetical protein
MIKFKTVRKVKQDFIKLDDFLKSMEIARFAAIGQMSGC